MSSLENRGKMRIRIDAVQRLAMWHCFSAHTPFVRICEYPKSGGTWLGQIIAGYLELPFPRNRRPPIKRMQPCVLHGHHLYHDRVKNIVCILRDGRDVMTSAYYHILNHHRSLFINDPVWQVLPSQDYRDVELNMPAFLEYMFTRPAFGGKRFARKKVSWRTFTQSWLEHDANIVRYEDMLEDASTAVAPVLHRLTGEAPDMWRLQEVALQFSFKNQTSRRPGEEDTSHFLRKGVAGDWRNKFTSEACEVFKHFAGDTLIQAGYEQDLSWSNVPPTEEASPCFKRASLAMKDKNLAVSAELS